jgi:hypothetical protein
MMIKEHDCVVLTSGLPSEGGKKARPNTDW